MWWAGCRWSVPTRQTRRPWTNESTRITPWWASAGQPTRHPSAPPRSRTGTPIGHRILSAARLPIPPVELGFVYAPSRYLTWGCDPPRGVGVCSPRSWRSTCLIWRSNLARRVYTRPYLSRRCSLFSSDTSFTAQPPPLTVLVTVTVFSGTLGPSCPARDSNPSYTIGLKSFTVVRSPDFEINCCHLTKLHHFAGAQLYREV